MSTQTTLSRLNLREIAERSRQDVVVALRGLRRTPIFAIAVVSILTLAIGMSTAMTSVFRAVLVDRLPVRDQDRIVAPKVFDRNGIEIAMLPEDLKAYAKITRTLSAVAGVAHWGATESPFVVGERPLVLKRALVTGNFFDVLGTRPVLGRLLHADDDVAGAAKNIVLSYDAWRRHFNGDSAIIGTRLIDSYFHENYPIVGVAPPGLGYPAGAEYWEAIEPVGSALMTLVGRLAPSATPAAAGSELFEFRRDAPVLVKGQVHLERHDAPTFADLVVGEVKTALIALTAAVGLLLLIACVNVGSLMLLRASSRSAELSIRRAIGASYGDLVRQLSIESGLLAVCGGALGLLCANALLHALIVFAPSQLPRSDVIHVDGTPATIAVGVTLVALFIFGLLPALTAARVDLATALRAGARGGAESRSRRATRQLLVASQVALALAMLAGAGLVARSLDRLQRIKLGYQPEHLSIFTLAVPQSDDPATLAGRARLNAHAEAVTSRLRAIPGVAALTPILLEPFHGTDTFLTAVAPESGNAADMAAAPYIPWEDAGADYFRTFGIPILRGRAFTNADREDGTAVVIVSQALANRFWPGQDAIGKRISNGNSASGSWRTVVGVAGDVRYRNLRTSSPILYVPWRQTWWQGVFAIRTTADLAAALPAMQRAVRDVDPSLSLWGARSMDDYIGRPLAQPRFSAALLAAFSLTALLLVAFGLYGLMSSIVRERTHEMGVRLALGATPARLQRDVLFGALRVTTTGAFAGLLVALIGTRSIAGLLFEVSPSDPVTLLVVSALLVVVALAAAYHPSRRATRIDPARALRAD